MRKKPQSWCGKMQNSMILDNELAISNKRHTVSHELEKSKTEVNKDFLNTTQWQTRSKFVEISTGMAEWDYHLRGRSRQLWAVLNNGSIVNIEKFTYWKPYLDKPSVQAIKVRWQVKIIMKHENFWIIDMQTNYSMACHMKKLVKLGGNYMIPFCGDEISSRPAGTDLTGFHLVFAYKNP